MAMKQHVLSVSTLYLARCRYVEGKVEKKELFRSSQQQVIPWRGWILSEKSFQPSCRISP